MLYHIEYGTKLPSGLINLVPRAILISHNFCLRVDPLAMVVN